MKTAGKLKKTLDNPSKHSKTSIREIDMKASKKVHAAKLLKRSSFQNWCNKKAGRRKSNVNMSEIVKHYVPLTNNVDDILKNSESKELNEDLKDVMSDEEIMKSVLLESGNNVSVSSTKPNSRLNKLNKVESEIASAKARKTKFRESPKKSQKRFAPHKKTPKNFASETKTELSFERISNNLETIIRGIPKIAKNPATNELSIDQKLLKAFDMIKTLKELLDLKYFKSEEDKTLNDFNPDLVSKRTAIDALKAELAHVTQYHQIEMEILKRKLEAKHRKEKDRGEVDFNNKIKELNNKHKLEIKKIVKETKPVLRFGKPISINIVHKFALKNAAEYHKEFNKTQKIINEQYDSKIEELNSTINEWKKKYNESIKSKENLEKTIMLMAKTNEELKNSIDERNTKLMQLEEQFKITKAKYQNVDSDYKRIVGKLSGENMKEVLSLEKQVIKLENELQTTKLVSAKEFSELKQKYEKEHNILMSSLSKKTKKSKSFKEKPSTAQYKKRVTPIHELTIS